jgi:hypothetical protein
VILQTIQDAPWTSLEQPSGTYFISTFRRRYRKKPNRGDSSSYCAIAFRISKIPPLPRSRRSTSSRDIYLSRNLSIGPGQLYSTCIRQGAGFQSLTTLQARRPQHRELLLLSHCPAHSATFPCANMSVWGITTFALVLQPQA